MLLFGTTILFINGLLIKVVYSQRRCLNWKRFACITNLAISDVVCGAVLMIRGVTDLTCNASHLLDVIFGLEVCASIIMTIFNYDCQLFIQYLAIKKPLFYHTKLTLTNILLFIGILWFIIVSYSAFKFILTIWVNWDHVALFSTMVDVVAMGLSLIFNSMFYSFVLRVAANRRKEILDRRQLSDKLSSSSTKSDSTPVIKQSIFHQYNSVITLGIQLITYISTICPLFVYWSYSSMYAMSTSENLNISGELINSILESFYFVRAILDPLIFLFRERHLLFSV